MPTDHDKAQRGKECQKRASRAYENGDLEQAYHHYVEAETLYREARDDGQYWVTDRLFFMQSSALRCLETILDDRPALFGVYRPKAEGFLEEWPETEISSCISAKRISEALAFREWRESYFKGSHDFNAAGVALDQGDVARARRILEEFIARTETSEHAEAEALCALARSKIEMLPVIAELRKHEQQRNHSVIAGGYLRAARASYLPSESTCRQRKRFAAYRAWFLSYACKCRAFSLLRKTRLPVSSLVKTQRYLARAIKYAQRAASLLDDFPQRHAIYLNYWHGIVSERAHLLTYMTGGDNADFDSARHAWQGALGAAKRLCEQGGEESFFPNRFYSIGELRIEQYFLDAAKAFRERRWPDCILLLETWRKECPQECSWSWRGVNVYIRLLGTKIINAVLTGGPEQLRALCTDLMKVSNSEPVGSAARFFADEVARLPEKTRNEPLLNLVLDSFAQYFPLDSHVDSYQQSEQIDQFASLPQKIHDSLQISPPSTEAEVERLKAVISGGIEAFLGYV